MQMGVSKNELRGMSRLAVLSLALLFGGCASVSKVATGDAVVGERMTLKLDTAWNQFGAAMTNNIPTWTVEGVTVDALQFYVGIKDGQRLAETSSAEKSQKPLIFKSGMQPADVVSLYEAMLTRDGSSFQLEKLEPAEFLGGTGFRFEYSLNRKVDDVPMRGLAYGAVRKGELFVIHYSAPRLVFFPRYVGRVEGLVRSAQLRS
ncbi:MAG: hypothetical protein ACK4S6_20385 [Roseateles asaccharophilus]|uniref:Lipoprotein n=1 Tax=Roseateles asaccharophilus TaxID=582607 RepID=A0A4R6MSF3_9BURK|nr:hypothetical protein [Roseateles asaccharophilus]MDN3546589.1 hypothetical protein [Roseateles asaccharophilus]TDP04989.1 hypothetical protein DFR39_11221 [Roseateles asaccharophilus]